jgi:hypothetical protein
MMILPQRLPGGSYRITREENATLCEALGSAPAGDDRAHPIFYYVATQAAMGVTVEGLCQMCDFKIADGPMMAQSTVSFDRDLLVERDYAVHGAIISLERKNSRTFGALDLLTYELRVSETDGASVARCVNQWVLPRRSDVAAA